MQNKTYIKITAALLLGFLSLWIPLLGDFHIESAILASLIGCFWAGWKACGPPDWQDDFSSALRILGYLYLFGLSLLLYALLTGCFSIHGLGFWLLFPLPSVFFGYAIGRLLRKWQIPARRIITIVILLAIAFGTLLYEFFHYPQVYFFNHVWGGWVGPIYDETVTLGRTVVFFRSMTLLWALLIWHIPALKREKLSPWIVGLSALALAFCYTHLAEMGVISPPAYIQSVLGGSKQTAHFKLYYDEDFYTADEISLIAKEHEFYLTQITDKLNLTPDTAEKIESYLYAHPWQKKRLVGAKFTSYVPVWLSGDQLHIAKPQLKGSLKHELVHVLAKQFGNRLFNASWSIGLIEGLAVAINGGPSPTTTLDQIVVSERPYPHADQLKQAFSPWGFYGGRAGVNYTTSGSFVQFLLKKYPPQYFKEAYRRGSITEAYPQDWQQLTRGWHRHLGTVTTDSVDRQVAARIFSIPSLFEQECPHTVSAFAEAWDRYQYEMAKRDTSGALQSLNDALVASDSLLRVQMEWSYQHLAAGKFKKVQQVAALQDTSVGLQLLYADAFMLVGSAAPAQSHLNKAQALFAQNLDSLMKPAIKTRTQARQWQIYRQMTYQRQMPDSAAFASALYRTKIRSLRKAIEREYWTPVEGYAMQLLKLPVQLRYFSDYLAAIHHLAFYGKYGLARKWIQKLEGQPLRNRFKERLNQQKAWVAFMDTEMNKSIKN